MVASTWQHASAGILLLEYTKYVTESSGIPSLCIGIIFLLSPLSPMFP